MLSQEVHTRSPDPLWPLKPSGNLQPVAHRSQGVAAIGTGAPVLENAQPGGGRGREGAGGGPSLSTHQGHPWDQQEMGEALWVAWQPQAQGLGPVL